MDSGRPTVMFSKENIPPGGVPASRQRKSAELWRERNEVITLLEHRENIQIARGIVNDVIGQAIPAAKQIPHSTEHGDADSAPPSGVKPTEPTAVDVLDILEQKVSDELDSVKKETTPGTCLGRQEGGRSFSSNSETFCSPARSPQTEPDTFRDVLKEHAYSSPKAACQIDAQLSTETAVVPLSGGAPEFVDCVAAEDLPYLRSEVVITSDENEAGGPTEGLDGVVSCDVPAHVALGSLWDTTSETLEADVEQTNVSLPQMTIARPDSDTSKSGSEQHAEAIEGISSCPERNIALQCTEENKKVSGEVSAKTVDCVMTTEANAFSNSQGTVSPEHSVIATVEPVAECQSVICEYTEVSLDDAQGYKDLHHLSGTATTGNGEVSGTRSIHAIEQTDNPSQEIEGSVANQTLETADTVISASLAKRMAQESLPETLLTQSVTERADDSRVTVNSASDEASEIQPGQDALESEPMLETILEPTANNAAADETLFAFVNGVTRAGESPVNKSSTLNDASIHPEWSSCSPGNILGTMPASQTIISLQETGLLADGKLSDVAAGNVSKCDSQNESTSTLNNITIIENTSFQGPSSAEAMLSDFAERPSAAEGSTDESSQQVEESYNDDSGVLSGTDTSFAQADRSGLPDSVSPCGSSAVRKDVGPQQGSSAFLPLSDFSHKQAATSAPCVEKKEDFTGSSVAGENKVEKVIEASVTRLPSTFSQQLEMVPKTDNVRTGPQKPGNRTGSEMETVDTAHAVSVTVTTGISRATRDVGLQFAHATDTMSTSELHKATSMPAEDVRQSPGHGIDDTGRERATENVLPPVCEAHVSHDASILTQTPDNQTVYFDAFSILTQKSESPESASIPTKDHIVHSPAGEESTLSFTSVESGNSHTNSPQGMDFAGVAIEGSTRLSANDTLLYDENVNPFAPQSVLPTDSIAPFDQSDSNDNTVVYNEGPSGDGDILASNSRHLAHSQAKQLKANRRSFTVRKDPLPEASNPEQSSGDRVPVPCPVPVEARRELKPNRRSFTVAKAPSVQGKPLSGTCGDRTTNTEASCANENLSRDSEAGPEVAEFSEEEFRCASEHFKDPSAFDFLQKFGGSKQLGRSSLGRCSLFLKFDPLLADRRQSIAPAKVIKEKESPVAVPPPDVPSAESKPEALIDWATSPKNLLDQTFPVRSDQVQTQEQMFSEKEMSQALKFQELMFQERLLKKDQDKSEQEKQMHRHFEAQDNTIRNMFQAIKELAKTCDNNVKEQQRITADLTEVTKERDQLVEDLRGVEAAFSDFHRRYEQAKDIIRTMKENETLLKSQMAETQDMLEKRNQMLSTLKTKAEESIETANKEIESSRKTMDAENTVLKAQLKKAEMKINSLEKHLEQKTEEISQLTQMYDDLLSKVQQN